MHPGVRSKERGSQWPGQQNAQELFLQRFEDSVVFLLLSPAPNLLVKRLDGDKGTVCTKSTLLPACH